MMTNGRRITHRLLSAAVGSGPIRRGSGTPPSLALGSRGSGAARFNHFYDYTLREKTGSCQYLSSNLSIKHNGNCNDYCAANICFTHDCHEPRIWQSFSKQVRRRLMTKAHFWDYYLGLQKVATTTNAGGRD